MDLFAAFSPRKKKIAKLLTAGQEAEAKQELETAYESYQQAAELGSTEAMIAIATLYSVKMFRPVEQSNMMELLLQGIPAFPWNTVTQQVPDMPSALAWFRKAADAGDGKGCYMTGVMLCEGIGCKADPTEGLPYLDKAIAAGFSDASKYKYLYQPYEKIAFTDEEYESLLAEFIRKAEAREDDCYELYARLKGGSDRQLARLGFAIVTAKNMHNPLFEPFKYSFSDNGIPLIPACAKRGSWKTFIRFDLNAFASHNTVIAFTSDIDPECILEQCHHLKRAGRARYISPAFGWLGNEKEAILFDIDTQQALDDAQLQEMAEFYHLIPEEYTGEDVAILTECGEKEYSVEIAAITGGKINILYRYTIGGSDEIQDMVAPTLLEVTIEEK